MTNSTLNGNSTEKSQALVRADALKAENPRAYKHFARYTKAMLEADMDRPPSKKPPGWESINTEEVRIKACLISHSGMWPICMPYAVLTLGDLGLTYKEAAGKGLKLGEDEGEHTFVLDENGEPKPLPKTLIAAQLGLRKQNVGDCLKRMDQKKVLHIDGKRLSIDPDPAKLTEAEREKVIRLDYFLAELPEDLREAINGFKPSRSDLALLASLPEVIRLDYFFRLKDIHSEYETRIEVIRSEEEKAKEVLRSEISILIDQASQVPQGSKAAAVGGTYEETEPVHETPPPPSPVEQQSPEPDPEPPPAPEPEPYPEPEPVEVVVSRASLNPEAANGHKPVAKPVPWVKKLQDRFRKNPPTEAQCKKAYEKLLFYKLSPEGFLQYLTPQRMARIEHGGALYELVESYRAEVAAKELQEPRRRVQSAPKITLEQLLAEQRAILDDPGASAEAKETARTIIGSSV